MTTNAANLLKVGWSDSRAHQKNGNVALSDGSVQQFTSGRLRSALNGSADPNAVDANTGNTLLFP